MNRVERFYAEERFVQLAADAIRAQHPHAEWLGRHGRIGKTGLTDAALEAVVERLDTWLSEHQQTPTGRG